MRAKHMYVGAKKKDNHLSRTPGSQGFAAKLASPKPVPAAKADAPLVAAPPTGASMGARERAARKFLNPKGGM